MALSPLENSILEAYGANQASHIVDGAFQLAKPNPNRVFWYARVQGSSSSVSLTLGGAEPTTNRGIRLGVASEGEISRFSMIGPDVWKGAIWAFSTSAVEVVFVEYNKAAGEIDIK